jgi:hypothetical protein
MFHGVDVDQEGRFNLQQVSRNLSRRPEPERRNLLDRSIMDLIERALSMTAETLTDAGIDALLREIAGYQRRLRN